MALPVGTKLGRYEVQSRDAPAARGGIWNRTGVIVFSPSGHLSGGLYRVSAAGGGAFLSIRKWKQPTVSP
jgi:hypothetical protein